MEIYINFTYLPERPDPADGEAPLPAESPGKYNTVIRKFDEYFMKKDSHLVLRERFWLHLKREPAQSFDSWVVTIREQAAECKFPPEFLEQAIRDKITFSCSDDCSKLKLYNEGGTLSITKATEIMSLRETTNRELQEYKTAAIDIVHSPTDQRQKCLDELVAIVARYTHRIKESVMPLVPVVTNARKLATFQLSAEALVLPK